MSNSAAIIGLDRALEVVQEFQKVDSKSLNLQLADQIQFSSILKMQVDTPEQTLAAAQGPVQPPERPARPEVSQQDRLAPRERVDDHASAPLPGDTKPEFAANVVDDHRGDHGQADDGAPQSNSANQSDTGSTANDEASVQTGDPNNGVSGVDDSATEDFVAPVAKPDDVRANNTSTQTNAPADAAMQQMARLASEKPGKAPESHGQLTSRTAQEILANALTSDKFQTVGEDLHMAVSNKPDTASSRPGNHSAGSALKNQQGSDLAQRLGGGIQASIQVSVIDSANARAMPIHALANGAMMAQMDPGDDGANLLNANLNQAGGKGVLPDRAAAGNHGADGKAHGQNTEQGTATNFGLAVRNQAIANANANAAANAVPKVAPITAESANLTNVSGPAGPSQISQTAKLNPTAAARQPYKPPVPVEQITMQIQKAVGEGADKINIKLNPAHLGRIEVKLQIAKDGHLSAVILAEKPETLSMLQKDAAGLEKALQEAGLRTDTSSLNFGLKENNNTTTEPGRDRENSHGRPSEKDDTPEDQKDQGLLQNANVYGRNMSANGGVDIRI